MTDGLYLLRDADARRTIIDGRRAWVVRAASAISAGAIVMLQRRRGVLVPRRMVVAAMRIHEVRSLGGAWERDRLALFPASLWPLKHPFTLEEALGAHTSYDRECPLVRLSALHEHAIRTSGRLGADVPPADRMELDEPVHALFHRLWTIATDSPRYDKSQWAALRQMLHQRGIVV